MNTYPFLTLREAAFVLDMPNDTVLQELDFHLEQVLKMQLGSGPIQRLNARDTAFLRLIRDADETLSPPEKEKIYRDLALSKGKPLPVEFGEIFYVDEEQIDTGLEERLRLLANVRSSVDQGEDGLLFIKGTEFEAYRVAALASNSIDEAKFGYPSISLEQIELAVQYAAIYPKPGEPYPTQSLKRMLLAAGFGELNEIVAAGRAKGTIFGEGQPITGSPGGRRAGATSLRTPKK